MTIDSLVGRLVLRPGGTPSVACERPMVGPALLGRLTEGRRAVLLPDLLATVFTLCADAQRSTARRAVAAALGLGIKAEDVARDRLAIAMHVAREHLQRFALDMPTLSGSTAAASVGWLRDAPVMALPAFTTGPGEQALRAAASALPGWLERRLFGMPPARWLEGWRAGAGDWLTRWSAERDHPVAQWLASVGPAARPITWSSPALDVLAEGDAGLRTLGAALAGTPHFAERPLWRGAPAETGPWTRHGQVEPVATAWDRLGARLAELARLALGERLALGALTLGDGEGLAWTEMSRGLLMHWVRLEPGERDSSTARAARYQVLAPTEWNFHPEGAFAQWLQRGTPDASAVRLAAATLDPCLAYGIEPETHDA
jgi:hypothetical protein